MRFISKFGLFGVQVRPMIQEAYATGMAKVIQEPLYANFKPGLMTPEERELAINHWTFNGFYQLEDEVSILPPDYRVGVFDSLQAQIDNSWSDEDRLEVERALLANASLTNNLFAVPVTLVAPPWPRYDEFSGTTEELLRRLVDDGHNLADVLTYERANQDRFDVIRALEGLINDPDALLELQPEEVIG